MSKTKTYVAIMLGIQGLLLLLATFIFTPQTAYAACNNSIAFTADKYQATWTDTIKFTLIYKNDGVGCRVQQVRFRVRESNWVKPQNVSGASSYIEQSGTIDVANGKAQYQFSLSLSEYKKKIVADPNQLSFSAEVVHFCGFPEIVCNEDNVKSQALQVQLSGGNSQTSGEVTGKMIVVDSSGKELSQFSKDQAVKVIVQIPNKQLINRLPDSIKNINLVLYKDVRKLGSFTKPRSDFQNADQYFEGIQLSEANGFKNGTNQLTAELWSADGSSQKLGSIGTGIRVAGFSDSASTQSGAGNQNAGGNTANSGSEQARLEYSGGLKDPVSYKTLGDLISGVIKFLLAFIGALAILFIVIGGIRMITAAGNETQLTAGKKTLTWAVIGLLVALLGYTLIGIVQRST